jgi:hypothetical protein
MLLGSTARLVREADILTAIGVSTVYTMWDPQHLTTHGTCCLGCWLDPKTGMGDVENTLAAIGARTPITRPSVAIHNIVTTQTKTITQAGSEDHTAVLKK